MLAVGQADRDVDADHLGVIESGKELGERAARDRPREATSLEDDGDPCTTTVAVDAIDGARANGHGFCCYCGTPAVWRLK